MTIPFRKPNTRFQSERYRPGIVGHGLSAPSDLPDEYSFAETMLFVSGRPLIIVPALPCPPTLGRRMRWPMRCSCSHGHAKLWEKMPGGATRDLLDGMRLPLLMSH